MQHNKNNSGFITIPILIAILLGTAVVGGGSYYVVKEVAKPTAVVQEISETAVATDNAPITEDINDEAITEVAAYQSETQNEKEVTEIAIDDDATENSKPESASVTPEQQLEKVVTIDKGEAGKILDTTTEEKTDKVTDIDSAEYLDDELPAKNATSTTKQYVVRYGDSLIDIASMFGVSPESIRNINGLTHTDIEPGTTLKIKPDASEEIDSSQTVISSSTQYIVREGDSLEQIAAMFGVSVESIMSTNNMTLSDVEPGTNLLIVVDTENNQFVKPPAFTTLYYVVRHGDTLTDIASMYKVAEESILKTNNLTKSDISPGITLKIVTDTKQE